MRSLGSRLGTLYSCRGRPHHAHRWMPGLDEVGPGHRMEPRAVLRHQLRRVVPRDELVEHPSGLGVHQEHRAMLPHLLEGAEQGPVIGLPAFRLVDHELLEGGEPALHHPLDL